jgi:hypothetical protein
MDEIAKKPYRDTPLSGDLPKKIKLPNEIAGVLHSRSFAVTASLNAFFASARSLLDESLHLAITVLETKVDLSRSINEVQKKLAQGEVTYRDSFGDEIADLIAQTWKWAKDLVDHRDRSTHFQHLIGEPYLFCDTQCDPTVFRLLIPSSPMEERKDRRTTDFDCDALEYAAYIGKMLREHVHTLTLAATRRKAAKNPALLEKEHRITFFGPLGVWNMMTHPQCDPVYRKRALESLAGLPRKDIRWLIESQWKPKEFENEKWLAEFVGMLKY